MFLEIQNIIFSADFLENKKSTEKNKSAEYSGFPPTPPFSGKGVGGNVFVNSESRIGS
jgi:hypothetical protein